MYTAQLVLFVCVSFLSVNSGRVIIPDGSCFDLIYDQTGFVCKENILFRYSDSRMRITKIDVNMSVHMTFLIECLNEYFLFVDISHEIIGPNIFKRFTII